MADSIPTEAQEGRKLVAWLRVHNFRFTHIANETGSGRGAKFQGIRNKQQGVSKGFPDYIIIVNNKLVFIELKRTKRYSVSPEQREWLSELAKTGSECVIAHGADEAIEFIESLAKTAQSIDF